MTGLDEADRARRLRPRPRDRRASRRHAHPGERTCAELAVLAHRRATCLLLDEPSCDDEDIHVRAFVGTLAACPGAIQPHRIEVVATGRPERRHEPTEQLPLPLVQSGIGEHRHDDNRTAAPTHSPTYASPCATMRGAAYTRSLLTAG